MMTQVVSGTSAKKACHPEEVMIVQNYSRKSDHYQTSGIMRSLVDDVPALGDAINSILCRVFSLSSPGVAGLNGLTYRISKCVPAVLRRGTSTEFYRVYNRAILSTPTSAGSSKDGS